jgi:hypothetical protein
MDWKTEFDKEIALAHQARERRNEGQARVCARRAAGIALREYFLRRGQPPRSPNAYELLTLAVEDPALPNAARQAASYLTLRVTEAFRLPVEIDLLEQAILLAGSLQLGE